MFKLLLSALALRQAVSQGRVPAADWYGLSAKDIDGNEFSFENLKGIETVIVTNVASA